MIKSQAYQKFAEAVATDLIESKIPLNDSIIKLARSRDMTQEQIKRLCEATNNVTFNKLFKQNKTASDRIVEFDVADASVILNSLIKRAEVKTAELVVPASALSELKDEMHTIRHPEPSMEKTASTFELRPSTGQLDIEIDRRTITKAREHLQIEKLACDMQYRDAINALRNQFRRLYDAAPFETFEKNAVALYGDTAVPHLSVLRTLMNKPDVEYNISGLEKRAGLVDDSSVELSALKKVIEIHNTRTNHTDAINKLENL